MDFNTSTTSVDSANRSWFCGEIKVSYFWKKMKALFLQTKICEVLETRINKNPLVCGKQRVVEGWNIQPNFGDANNLAFYFF